MTEAGVAYLEVAGSPAEMGRQHGEHFREQIAAFAEQRLATCRGLAREAGRRISRNDVLEFCERLLAIQADALPEVHDEFIGIAEGADVDPALLMIGNGLTDIVDYFVADHFVPGLASGGCTACLVAPDATAEGAGLAAQTWDMQPYAEAHVVVIARRPADGPDTLCMTTAGCLSLAGINQVGLAVGNNNLMPIDAKPGLIYLALIHRCLAQRSLAAAINFIAGADRLSGHNYYLVGPEGQYIDVETTATECEIIDPAGAFYVHSNHYLIPRLGELEQPDAVDNSTTYRLNRMGAMLHEQVGRITVESLQRILADNAGRGDCNLCRTDPGDVARTCAAVILEPEAGLIHVAKGPPDRNPFATFAI